MPHRTVFQVGKNHVHPFTMFLGGFVAGALTTAAVAGYAAIKNVKDDVTTVTTPHRSVKSSTNASSSPSVQPSASPTASF